MSNFLEQVALFIEEIFGGEANVPPTPEPIPPPAPPLPPPPPKYLWDTKQNIIHSIRVLCDEMGMTLEAKNTMTATIGAESEYKLTATCKNYVTKNGKKVLSSTDWGLCQWNDFYHGSEITPQEAVNDPEKAVRLMGKYWKMGETYRCWWVAYRNGSFKKYL